jgi:hypothetical protein
MRQTLLFAAVAIAIAACGDNQPASPAGLRPQDAVPSHSATAAAAGKPAPQTGFTDVTTYQSLPKKLYAGGTESVTMTCPAGTKLVGGGYGITEFVSWATPPWILQSHDDRANGWQVTIANGQNGASPLTFYARVYCAS